LYFAGFHQRGRHIVTDERVRNSLFLRNQQTAMRREINYETSKLGEIKSENIDEQTHLQFVSG
jgi:hypothetical protein